MNTWTTKTLDGDVNGTNYQYSPAVEVADSNGRRVAHVYLASVGYSGTQDDRNADEANARLIAAAPELLEALEQLYDSFTITGAITGNKGNKAKHDIIKHNDDVRKALNVTRAAIAKAKG